jgi:carboxyl-terminal processing protease
MKNIIILAAFIATVAQSFSQTKGQKPSDMAEFFIRPMIQDEYYPKAPDSLYQLEWEQLVSRLDEYTYYNGEEETAKRNDMLIGSQVKGVTGIRLITKDSFVVVTKVWKDGPAYNQGIGIGDTILSVAGKIVKNHEDASANIRGEVGTKVAVSVARAGKRFNVELERSAVKVSTAMGKKQGNTLRFKVFMFSEGVTDSISNIASRLGTKGIDTVVLDLRGNSGGLLSEGESMAALFVKVGDTVLVIKNRKGEEVIKSEAFSPLQNIKNIVVLVDSGTASSAEIVAGTLKARRNATVVGTKSYGKGVIQRVKEVEGGSFKMTVAEYFAGGTMKIQGVGIQPDVLFSEKPVDPKVASGLDLKKFRELNPLPSLDALKKAGLNSDVAEYIWGDLGIFELR